MDPYGKLLGTVLFPAFEAVRGRPTLPLLQSLLESQHWDRSALQALQMQRLQRLLQHAYSHTDYYRGVFDAQGITPAAIRDVSDLARLPLLTREAVQTSVDARTSKVPPFVAVKKYTSGTTGQPVPIAYSHESRHWRDAVRMRGYGWAGHRPGVRTLHYWGIGVAPMTRAHRLKLALDHRLKRDHYVDCSTRNPEAMRQAVRLIRRVRPHCVVAYSQGAAALARFIVSEGLRDWEPMPVICGAERVWPHDRAVIEQALGPVFETYGSREFMLMAAECEAHDGMHLSMETQVLELIVRKPDGSSRPAAPGETGQVVVTDLQNLACPMIRYVTGDLAVARAPAACACGRGLDRIGAIDGRVIDTLQDAHGNAVSGMAFAILFATIAPVAKQYQVVQARDLSVTLKVVLSDAARAVHGPGALPAREAAMAQAQAAKYFPGVPFSIAVVDAIPTTAAGKLRVVVKEGGAEERVRQAA